MIDAKTCINDAQEKMDMAVMYLEEALAHIRAGKASTRLLDGIRVDSYGSMVPISNVAAVTTPDARSIAIKPWDKSMFRIIEKAIMDSDLGITPENNGEIIRLGIPPLTEERRKQLAKQCKGEGETAKVSIRNARRDAIDTLKKAIAIGKEKNIDFLLAVGGGSVIDGTKLISAGIPYEGDAWELVKKGSSQVTIPLGTVLTIPATGSEMNNGAVISRRETHEKYPFYADYPVFSILDPTVTFSLPDFQIACGLADTFVHVMEQYMTKSNESYLMDRWSESILRTLVQIAPLIKENKQDYHLMSEFMMSATMALNGFIAMGVSQDWATHMIGHELTALHGMTHGQTLAIVFPGTLRTLADKKRDKILQYGERIWGVTSGVPSARIALTIDKTEEFFKSLGLKTRLGEAGIGDDTIEEIARRFDERGAAFGEDGDVTGEVARRILQNCK